MAMVTKIVLNFEVKKRLFRLKHVYFQEFEAFGKVSTRRYNKTVIVYKKL